MTKSLDWKYEDEYRILCRPLKWKISDGKRFDLLLLTTHQIKWICAGVRTPKEDIESLRKILLTSSFPNAPLCQASLHPIEFKVLLPEQCSNP